MEHSSAAEQSYFDAHAPSKRLFRLSHQTLCISTVDFSQRNVVGYTQFVIWPLEASLKRIHLNVRQCRIYRTVVESAEDHFKGPSDPYLRTYPPRSAITSFSDPCYEICRKECKLRRLDIYEERYAAAVSQVDADEGGGELAVLIPNDLLDLVRTKEPILLTVEFVLENPKYGFHFVIPSDGNLETAYAFTGGSSNSSRSWFPCIDSSEPCTWKIEVTVSENFVAIAPGELVGPPEYTEDLRCKTYQFYLGQPTSAPLIGLVVGAFEIYQDSMESHITTTLTHFCPKSLLSLLKHSVEPLPGIVEHYEGELASQFPYHSLAVVFVDRAFEDHQSFASLIVFSVDLLYSPRIIDQSITTRRIFAFAVAQQFFGSLLQAETWAAAWLPYGIAGYLSGLYQRRVFGNNEYRYLIDREMRCVTDYENSCHGIILDPSTTSRTSTYFSLKNPQLLSPEYLDVYIKKAHLVIRMLGLRFGQRVLLQVFNKLVALARLSASSVSGEREDDEVVSKAPPTMEEGEEENSPPVPPALSGENRSNLLLSTESFRRIILTVTGQDIGNFLDQWVLKSGHVRVSAKFAFNRKRNVVELDLKPDLQSRSILNYTGPLTAALQELDGPFTHTFKMDEGRTTKELQCHSKSRKHKKKKIPLSNGEEVEMDLGRVDPDSPLLWLRLDPDLSVIRCVTVEQPDYSWHFMLAYERDCLGQLEAVRALSKFASPETRLALSTIIQDEQVFYRVRMEACFVLCSVLNDLGVAAGAGGGAGGGGVSNMGAVGGGSNHHAHQNASSSSSVMLQLFCHLFSSPLARDLVRQNDFSVLQRYFLQKALISSMAGLRYQQVCPREVVHFLAEINQSNDNSRNQYADCYYRAEVIKALKDTLTPAIMMRGAISIGTLPSEVRTVVEEVVHCLNNDAQIPSYQKVVTVACLHAIRRLQRFSFLPVEPSLFYKAAAPGQYIGVRMAAIECLVDYVRGERDEAALNWLFDEIIEKVGCTEASHARLRYETVRMLIKTPPFGRGEEDSRLDSPQLADRIWALMNHGCEGDSRLRCALADLYFCLYNGRRPSCLPATEGVLYVRSRDVRSYVKVERDGLHEGPKKGNLVVPTTPTADGGMLPEGFNRQQVDARSPPLKRRMEHLSDDDDDDDFP